jgi:preprotein translocase subunit SecG
MMTTLVVLHVFICILLTIVVLLQFGKGAEVGAVMGSGSSQNVFSSATKGNFFTKFTTVLAIGFMVNSVALSILKTKESKKSIFDNEAPVAAPLNRDAEKAQETAPVSTPAETAPATK